MTTRIQALEAARTRMLAACNETYDMLVSRDEMMQAREPEAPSLLIEDGRVLSRGEFKARLWRMVDPIRTDGRTPTDDEVAEYHERRAAVIREASAYYDTIQAMRDDLHIDDLEVEHEEYTALMACVEDLIVRARAETVEDFKIQFSAIDRTYPASMYGDVHQAKRIAERALEMMEAAA